MRFTKQAGTGASERFRLASLKAPLIITLFFGSKRYRLWQVSRPQLDGRYYLLSQAIFDCIFSEAVELLSVPAGTAAPQADVQSAAPTTSKNRRTDQPILNPPFRRPYDKCYRHHLRISSRMPDKSVLERYYVAWWMRLAKKSSGGPHDRLCRGDIDGALCCG